MATPTRTLSLSSQPLPPVRSRDGSWAITFGPGIPANIADSNRIYVPPTSGPPIDHFEVEINDCTAPDWRFISRTDRRTMLMFIDGASSRNGAADARAGCGVVFSPTVNNRGICHRLETEGGPQTNSRAELRAAILALQLRVWKGEGFNTVVLATDSEYVVKGVSEWALMWRENGWRTYTGKKVQNQDLWKLLFEAMGKLEELGCQVKFWRIPREWNEADQLAKDACVGFSRNLYSQRANFYQELDNPRSQITKVIYMGHIMHS